MALSVGVIHQLLSPGSAGSRLAYGIMGFCLLFLIDPVRLFLRQFVHFIFHRRFTNYDLIQQQCMSVFVDQGDFFAVCGDIKRILQRGFNVNAVELVLKVDGQYQQIERTEMVPRLPGDPMLRYWKEHPEEHISHSVGDTEQGISSEMVYAFPLSVERRFIGWIAFYHTHVRYRFFLDDRRFFDHLQPLLSVAFQRLRIERKLEHRIDELMTLNRISQTMNSSLHSTETLESIMDAVIDLTGVDRALMYLSDEEGKFFTPVLGRGLTDDVRLDFTVEVSNSIFRHMISTREPLVVEDVANDPRINQEYAAFVKTTSFVAVPIVYKEKVIGILGVDNRKSQRSVKDIHLDTLVALANHAATALANSRMFERMQQFNSELQQKVEEATNHLKQLIDVKSHFLTVASHQLRTPTTIVRGLLSMLVEDPDMPQKEQRKFVAQAFTSMNRLERIISELLSATELEDHTVQAYVEEIDPVEFVHGVVNNLEPLARERKINLKTEFAVQAKRFTSDRFKLQEALSNLVDNAIRYTKKGSVEVHTIYNDNHIEFCVRDTGIGLTPEDRKIIFEKFRRGDHGIAVEPNGSGLGLYIVKRILEILHGEIIVESSGRNRGSTFRISIPLQFPDGAQSAKPLTRIGD